jgi:hypothetical protein
MTDEAHPSVQTSADDTLPGAAPGKPLTPAARRALEEAQARREQAAAEAALQAPELQGPNGPEPTRFGDWERKGIAVDF